MNWRRDIDDALSDFRTVSKLADYAGDTLNLRIEHQPAPHKPASLPKGDMAVYAFWGDGGWLKIGKAGQNSNARFQSQHYSAGSSRSNLAQSLLKWHERKPIDGFTPDDAGEWIRAATHRVNIFIPREQPKSLLALLEAFLHARLNPRFEGNI